MVRGDEGAEPLHAGARGPVDEVLLDLQQGVERELEQLDGGRRHTSVIQRDWTGSDPSGTSEGATHLLLKRQLVGILHHHVVIIVVIIIASGRGHDGRGSHALCVLLGHLHKVVQADVGAGCRDTQVRRNLKTRKLTHTH